ncbi:MAG: isocitrate lyase/phosphoenolpyruvate mutase family protein [Myxococcota bacterium]
MGQRQRFLELHKTPFIIPNPWDRGSVRLLETAGFPALATTSAGFAGTRGRLDGDVTRDEVLAHARDLVGVTELPISADLENGFGDRPEDAAETIRGAAETGLAGGSIEDYGGPDVGLYPAELAAERIRAAVEANQGLEEPLVLTARAENHFRGHPDLADTITRLQAFQEAGADVLYAPGLSSLEDFRSVVASVDRPINGLILPGGPSVPELFEAGVTRVSTGSALHMATQAALLEAAQELLGAGTHAFWQRALAHAGSVRDALS